MANGCPPRRRRSTCRPGKMSRNPYINFLRDFRKKHCGLHPVQVIRMGAQAWNCLRDQERLPYIRMAFYKPIRRMPCPTRIRRQRRRPSRSRSQSRCRMSCPMPKKRRRC
ncbi:AAEL003164-PA [Aedes aegypti]|uniref:AAEL003164-PA n=1 Tax=Aedes aegypti TaxID=7159 RepID=Q17G86_AEDAE|nr:AAEL003164-PA [Aedes aegypti]